MIRGAYSATPGGWLVFRPMVGDVIQLIEFWGKVAPEIAKRRNVALLRLR